MIQTRITEMLGIRYPIVGGTMMWISDADFVASISNAGGLGVLASAIYDSKQAFAEAVDRVQAQTDQPFAVNLNLFPAMRPIDNSEYLDVLLEKGVGIVETSGHAAPEDLSVRFKEAGLKWIHKCVGVRYAKKAQSLGADVITVVGYENGGATGKLDIGTLVLVPTVVDAVDLPVIGGGGVSDGRGVAAVLSLGAEAVIMGTRLLVTAECPIHNRVKEGLLRACELDTMLIMRSVGATHRVWANAPAHKCAELEAGGADFFKDIYPVVSGEKAKEMFREGDTECGILSVGQGIGICGDIPTVAELFERIMAQAEASLGRFS